MKRILQFFVLLALALFFPSYRATAQMFFPVIHTEPMTVRVMDAQDGHPYAHLHVALVGGYDRTDVEKRVWREDAITDEHGEIRLPSSLVNLPWLGILMPKAETCKRDPRTQSFSVERVRNDGLSAPNRCGTATVSDRPGVFAVFAQNRKPAHKLTGSGEAMAAADNSQVSEIKAR